MKINIEIKMEIEIKIELKIEVEKENSCLTLFYRDIFLTNVFKRIIIYYVSVENPIFPRFCLPRIHRQKMQRWTVFKEKLVGGGGDNIS